MRRQAGWHADREEAAFRLLQLVDFDENVGFRTVVDVATETGCVQIAHAVDGVGPGPLAVRHSKYDETAPCVGERDHGLPEATVLGLALLLPRLPRLECKRLGLERASRLSVETIQQLSEFEPCRHD